MSGVAAVVRRHWPLALSLALLWVAIAALLAASLAATDGHVVYALDDPYIHLAMAKNLAQHGVLGVTRYAFTSTTSSPLWTLLLALLFAVFGVRDAIPLLVNLVLATGAVVLGYRIIAPRSTRGLATCAVLAALILLTPLPALVVSGTEHVLQVVACLAFAWVVARVVSASPGAPGIGRLALLAPLASAVRYEDLFLVATAAVLLTVRQRARAALLVVLLACVPGVLYGIYSASHDWAWLPNSVLVKGALPRHVDSWRSTAAYATRWAVQLTESPPMFAAALMAASAAVVALDRRGAAGNEGPYLVALFAGTALLHLQFANLGSFYRYEAYLIALSVLGAGVCAVTTLAAWQADPSSRRLRSTAVRATAVAIALLVCLPLGGRALASLVNSSRATRNIYQQQVQVGRFLQRFYAGQPVAINDIGAINYVADVHSLDLWGLADRQVAELRRSRRYTTDDIRAIARARGVRVAVVYEAGFARAGGLPRDWIKVAEWEIPDNFICGWATVSFWAVDPDAAPDLKRDLDAFASELPRGVRVRRLNR